MLMHSPESPPPEPDSRPVPSVDWPNDSILRQSAVLDGWNLSTRNHLMDEDLKGALVEWLIELGYLRVDDRMHLRSRTYVTNLTGQLMLSNTDSRYVLFWGNIKMGTMVSSVGVDGRITHSSVNINDPEIFEKLKTEYLI
jgi:hypothetical protein